MAWPSSECVDDRLLRVTAHDAGSANKKKYQIMAIIEMGLLVVGSLGNFLGPPRRSPSSSWMSRDGS